MFVTLLKGDIWIQMDEGDPTTLNESWVIAASQDPDPFSAARAELQDALKQLDALEKQHRTL